VLLKAKLLRGLPIGYDAVKSDFKDGVRYLREFNLFEVSLVVMPMSELAIVTSIKASNPEAQILLFKQLIEECTRRL
jgi:hypothetical protein